MTAPIAAALVATALVADASVVAPALIDDDTAGDLARAALVGHTLFAPELLDLEVVSVLRRAHRTGQVDSRRAELALADLMAIPVRRVGHRRLVVRCYQLRDSLSAYDAAYVALAEMLDIGLLTADARLAGSPGLPCQVELLAERR